MSSTTVGKAAKGGAHLHTLLLIVLGVAATLLLVKSAHELENDPVAQGQKRHLLVNKNDRTQQSSVVHHYLHCKGCEKKRRLGEKDEVRIAFMISVTKCHWSIIDAAAIHGYAIDLQHQSGVSRYAHRRYAFVHTTAVSCRDKLEKLGYQVLLGDSPINVEAIRTAHLKDVIEKEGCCGSKEFMKLYAYTLKEPIAVHLDTDVLMLQPMDELFDAMLGREPSSAIHLENEDAAIPKNVDFFYTRDYYQGSKLTSNTTKWGVQGGFFIVKTDRQKYQRFVDIIQDGGKYTKLRGWGREGFGGYWGAAQIQGFLSYMYHNDTNAVELNRCVYNNMHDPLYFDKGRHVGKCTTLKETCSHNCRKTPYEQVKLAHLTQCTKPWMCQKYHDGFGLCSKFLAKWFTLRQQLEAEWNQNFEPPPQDEWFYNASLGYCHLIARPNKRQEEGKIYKTTAGGYTRMTIPKHL